MLLPQARLCINSNCLLINSKSTFRPDSFLWIIRPCKNHSYACAVSPLLVQMNHNPNKKIIIQVETKKRVTTFSVRAPAHTKTQEEDRNKVNIAEKEKSVFIAKRSPGSCFPQLNLVDMPEHLLKDQIFSRLDVASLMNMGSVSKQFLKQVDAERFSCLNMADLPGVSAIKLFAGRQLFRCIEKLKIPLKDFILATCKLPTDKVQKIILQISCIYIHMSDCMHTFRNFFCAKYWLETSRQGV